MLIPLLCLLFAAMCAGLALRYDVKVRSIRQECTMWENAHRINQLGEDLESAMNKRDVLWIAGAAGMIVGLGVIGWT